MSRDLPGIFGHVPWRPCEPARRPQARRWAGERSSPDPGDVNTHVRNIYAKLQAPDRFSAVRRVRELRLLAAGVSHPPWASPLAAMEQNSRNASSLSKISSKIVPAESITNPLSAVTSAPQTIWHGGERLPPGCGDCAGQRLWPPGRAGGHGPRD